ncbi:MAG: 3-isopropylmalate dehydratase large subunit [Candidatus Brocadiia bacterium]
MHKMTFAEKALAYASGKQETQAGAVVTVEPHICLSHDNSAAIAKNFKEIGAANVRYPDRILIILDHCVPAADEKNAANHRDIREFVRKQGIKHFYDINYGICHQVLPEEGFARPGGVIVGSDSHTTTAGAFGAFAVGIGRTEAAAVWATGKMWLRVPETIRIELTCEFRRRVGAKDLALKILGDIGADGALYRAVEFAGPAVAKLTMADRMLLCNLAAEAGAKNAFFPSDKKTRDFLATAPKRYEEREILPDEGASYERVINYDLSEIEPGLACPHTVDNYSPVTKKAGTVIHEALIGTCTNGRIEDFREAAEVLKGKKVSPTVRLLVFPASTRIYRQMIKEGLAEIFLDAGGVLMNSGCGPCLGAHEGVLAVGEVCISTANRNFKGRMGCNEAFVYLASPATVAASAVAGTITSPV